MGAHTAKKLSAASITKGKKDGFHSDGNCLFLQVKDSGKRRRWVFRYTLKGKTRDIGLGGIDNDPTPIQFTTDGRQIVRTESERIAATTAAVRDKAAYWCTEKARGIDPHDLHQAEGKAVRAAERQMIEKTAPAMTFDRAAKKYIEIHSPGWRNNKHRQQWANTLATYASPVIGKMDVAAIEPADVLKVLEPIWRTKTETASRVRSRIENILDWAIWNKHRTAENPARWKGGLKNSLPSPGKIKTVKHHPALPYAELPGLMAQLVERSGIDALALRFTTLTAVRTSEAIEAVWDEFDLEKALWSIPAQRTKPNRVHIVPLSRQALGILNQLAAIRQHDFVFPGMRPKRPLSNMAMLNLIGRLGLKGQATTHGMRSTLKDWTIEETNFGHLESEMSLAHAVGSDVERAYRRSDLLKKRRALMQAWADYCTEGAGKVIPMHREAANAT